MGIAKKIIITICIVCALALIGAGVYTAFTINRVNDLTYDIKNSISDNNFVAISDDIKEMKMISEEPLWRIACSFPIVGNDFDTSAQLIAATDVFFEKAIDPNAEAIETLMEGGVSSLSDIGGAATLIYKIQAPIDEYQNELDSLPPFETDIFQSKVGGLKNKIENYLNLLSGNIGGVDLKDSIKDSAGELADQISNNEILENAANTFSASGEQTQAMIDKFANMSEEDIRTYGEKYGMTESQIDELLSLRKTISGK